LWYIANSIFPDFSEKLTVRPDKALGFVAVSQNDWIQNAVHERCRIAIEEIVASEVQRKLAANETISGTKEDIVNAAPIKSAATRQAEQDELDAQNG
jgi:hypothetical protein